MTGLDRLIQPFRRIALEGERAAFVSNLGEGLIPKKPDTAAVKIWTPQAP